ncbi:MAG: hypothetical protein CMO01_06355 [Thalassobius sp.]|nr:hypothetical protein [Thalassovita sp.]
MKKKITIWTVVLLIIGSIVYLSIYFFLSPSHNLQGIYLVPQDAIYIIETDEPVESWLTIRSSKIWTHLEGNQFFATLTESINSLDTLIQENKMLISILGSREVYISAHMTKSNDYDFLYVVDLQRVSKLSPLKTYIESLTSEGFKTTFRKYEEQEIIELLDLETRETLYMSFLNNQLVISYTHTLVEASIREMNAPIIGRDLQFLDVSKKVDYSDMFRLYINYNYLDDYLSIYSEDEENYGKYLSDVLRYSALSVETTDDDKISMEGFTSINNNENSYVKALLESGKGSLDILNVAPLRTGFYLGIGFNNFRGFIENFENVYKKEEADYNEYMQNMDRVERFLDIDLQKNFFDWIDDELAFIQTQPGKLGKDNEFLVVLKAKDGDDATKNLDFISEQIRKKTPVKFRQLDYGGYQIKYLSVKGLFKLILGKLFSKLEKPYYTVIDKYVIFSNHPQTIKSIIDDYNAKNTLSNSENFNKFLKNFDSKSNVFAYVQTPVMFENLKGMVNPETWTDIRKNKDYINCFSDLGFQISNDGDLFSSKFFVQFQDLSEVKALEEELAATVKPFDINELDSIMQLTLLEKDDELVIEEISPDDLDAKKYQEYFDNGNLKVEVALKNGLKNGTYREYFEKGSIKIKGKYKNDVMDGIWKIYDEKGNVMERKRYRNGKEL